MLSALQALIYVQVMQDSFELLYVQQQRSLHQAALRPFATPRLAVGHFEHAEATLQAGVRAITGRRWLVFAPVLVMHQQYLAEGGLSQVEERVLRELAMGVGARQVFIWQGPPLSQEQLLQGVYKSASG